MRFLISIIALACIACGAKADELDEVNAKRAQRGLPAFQRDAGLTQAARSAATYRAERLMFDHTANDFQFLPAGSTASEAGCAAYPPQDGFLACCLNSRYIYAGAASVVGRDGRAFHHIFVSNSPSTGIAQAAAVEATTGVVYAAAPATTYTYRERVVTRGRQRTTVYELVPVVPVQMAPPAIPKFTVVPPPPVAAPPVVTVVTGCPTGGCANGSTGNTTIRNRIRIINR